MDETLDEKNKVVFKKTSDPMISAGIIGLYKYCEKRKKEKNDFKFEINGSNELKIQSENLEKVLKEMYYEMGKDFYDTSTKKQFEKNEGFFYDEEKDEFVRFPKVKTTGMSNLIHDAQPTPLGKTETLNNKKNKSGEITTEGIESNNPELYKKIITFGREKHITLGKKIWINDRNTATPKLEKMKIEKGMQKCAICGESFKKTYESKSFSPFIGGSSASRNFVSMTKGTEKICWKCFYLQRFSPVCAFYYNDYKNENLNIFLFNSNSLEGMKKINHNLLKDIFYTKDQLIDNNYSSNFHIYNFEQTDKKIYFNLFSELFLLLLYTIYKKVQSLKQEKTDLVELFKIEIEDVYNTEVFFFQTKKFASTMRPVKVDKFTEIYYIFYLFKSIDENNSITFFHLLQELLLWKNDKNQKLDRAIIRNEWAEKVLKRKSTIKIIEKLVCMNFSKKDFRNNFFSLIEWLIMYESLINYGGNKMMNDEIRDLAIKLGNQIGFAAKNDKNPTAGKGKLISMKKARTLSKFLDQIISFISRYNLVLNRDFLTSINEENFDYFRQFTIISALSSFNISRKENKNTDGGKDE
ncbi:MAG: hypothetical protein P9L95_07835 [Candidatus Tenebribacter mawsonii]|nr:hypothetical protein [Candidatus Tenebribacter mawsonii]